MSARAKAGCGCGATSSAGCGCASCGGVKTAPSAAGPFERPAFFAGQLLTEDDLQQLVDYVVAKNRLHNRALLGDGVVCGLQVTCDPCGGAQIAVQPGYALDCCGNDIVIDCAVTLDINRMIRDLRAARLGQDCGDPCKDVKSDCAEPTSTAPAPTAKRIEPTPLYLRLGEGCKDVVTTPPRPHAEEYCLYVRYHESGAGLVAPYATDDCSASSCQPTRTREGYVFELRCKTKPSVDRTILDTARDCLGDLGGLHEKVVLAGVLNRAFDAIAVSGERVLGNKPLEFTSDHASALDSVEETLKQRLNVQAPSEAEIIDGVFDLIELGALNARARLSKTSDGPKGADGKLVKVEGSLVPAEALEYYAAQAKRVVLPFAQVLVSEAVDFFESQPKKLDVMQLRVLANGALVTQALLNAGVEPGRALYATLRERTLRARLTRCGQAEKGMQLPQPSYDSGTLKLEQAVGFAHTVSAVGRLTHELILGCFCDALNPPCSDCDDPAVLLACIEWRDCKVTDICNLERKWVITGPNLRYWLPELGQLGQRWETLCCAEPCDRLVLGKDVAVVDGLLGGAARNQLNTMLAGLGKVLPASAASPATSSSVPAPAPVPAADLNSQLAATQARIEGLMKHNEELAARVERLESRKRQ